VLGSAEDLAQRGITTRVFTQPGVWTDSLYFDVGAKLNTWRGALIQEFFTSFEAYVTGPYLVVPPGDSARFGVSHITLDRLTTDSLINRFWKTAMRRGRYINLIIHTRLMTRPDQFVALFDSLEVAVSTGRVSMVSSLAGCVGPATGPLAR